MKQENFNFRKTENQIAAMELLLEKKITDCFTGKSIADIRHMIEHDEDTVLEWLMQVGTESEIYELCAAVRDVLADRNNS